MSRYNGQPIKNPANRGLRIRIYPTDEQQKSINQNIGNVRKLHNLYVEYNRDQIKNGQKTDLPLVTYFKNQKQYNYLGLSDAFALMNAREDVTQAIKNHIKNPKHFGRPKYKKRPAGGAGKYTTNCVHDNIKLKPGQIKLPKLGWVKTDGRTLPPGGILKKATVEKDSTGRYYVSVGYHIDEPEHTRDEMLMNLTLKRVTGLDYSSPEFFVNECGITPEQVKCLHKSEKRVAKLQRQLARKKKGSKNREKARRALARVQKKVANQRRDFVNKVAYAIAKHYTICCIENLDLKAIASRKNKHHLGKSTYNNSYGTWSVKLDRKMRQFYGQLVKISKWFPSTNTCSCCGHRLTGDEKLSLSDRMFVCPECGSVMDRDRNAGVNIMREGLCELLEQHNLLHRFEDEEQFKESVFAGSDDVFVMMGSQGRVFVFDVACKSCYHIDPEVFDFCAGGLLPAGRESLGRVDVEGPGGTPGPVLTGAVCAGVARNAYLRNNCTFRESGHCVVSVSDVSYVVDGHGVWDLALCPASSPGSLRAKAKVRKERKASPTERSA